LLFAETNSMSWIFIKLFFILFVLLLPVSGWAAPFVVPSTAGALDVSDAFVSQVEDEAAPLEPEALKDSESGWAANPKSWAYGDQMIWLRARFQNSEPQASHHVLALSYASPTIADFFVYDAQGRLLKKVSNGTFSPWSQRELKLNMSGIHLDIPPGEWRTILVRMQSKSLVDTHFVLRPHTAHAQLEWLYLAAYGLYFGLALALFFHNLSLYFSVRDKVYLYYLALVACISLAMCFSSAYYALFWYRLPAAFHNFPYATPSMVHIVAPLFVAEFLHFKFWRRWVGLGLALISCAGLAVALLQLTLPSLGNRFNIYLTLTAIVVYIWACLHRILQGERYAWFLLAAVMSPMLAVFGYFVGTFLLQISVHADIIAVAFALEMLLMSMGLAHRVYIIRQHQHQMEAEQAILVRESKMQALASMSSGVAHEVNNPLMIISGYADVIRRVMARPNLDVKRLLEATEKIDHCVERIAFIVNALRSFSQEGEQQAGERFSLIDAIEKTLSLCSQRIKDQGIQLELDIDAADFWVLGSRSQCMEVILMLLDNAVDALSQMPEKRIVVQMKPHCDDSRPQVRLTIQDSGPGLPSDLQSQLFQPFFTTKAIGEGVGLSLSRSHGIIQAMGGELLYTRQEATTQFTLHLPLAA
jgi:signal transduction histidine kinase